MKKTLTIAAIVLAASLASCPFWAAFSAEDKGLPESRPEATPQATSKEVRPEAKPEDRVYPSPRGPSMPSTPARSPASAGKVVQAMGEHYGKAISEAVAAGDLKEEEVRDLNREFETIIAVRKARLEIMRAIHLLEPAARDNNTKQGEEARRLMEALLAALQMEQRVLPTYTGPGPVVPGLYSPTPAPKRPPSLRGLAPDSSPIGLSPSPTFAPSLSPMTVPPPDAERTPSKNPVLPFPR